MKFNKNVYRLAVPTLTKILKFLNPKEHFLLKAILFIYEFQRICIQNAIKLNNS